MSCGHQLAWYELIPIFSWLALGGKCKSCKAKISAQYPIVEAVNGILYVVVFYVCGLQAQSIIYCLMVSALLVLSVIDERTGEIPPSINLFLLVLGICEVALHRDMWPEHLIGMLVVSGFLGIIFLLSKGRAIGGGDVKLMATTGLILGAEQIVLAFMIGCIAGAVIHLIRMKISDAEHVLAFGPYLSAGVFIAAVWGTQMIDFYFNIYLVY